ncbi:MAG: peptidase S41, partial [Sphingomonas sp.]
DRPLAPPGYVQKLRFERTPPALDRYLDTWDDSFRTLGVGGKRLADGFISLPGGNAAQTITPASKRLTLPVATLIGPTNSSATFQFALMARASGKVRLFGRTTGGNQRGINGGAFFFVRLPASGLEFDLPLIGNFATRPVPDAGLAPDVMIAPTPADIAAGRDPALDAAMAWVTRA